MALCPIPSRGRTGGIVPPVATAEGTVTPMEGVVGRVPQVDPEAHPYPLYLLMGPMVSRAWPPDQPASRGGEHA
jgi:hypothetical protein